MITGSLRGRLLWWLLLPLAVFVAASGALSFDNAHVTADLIQDDALLASVRIIGEDIDWDNGSISVQIPPAALELFESPEHDSVFYRVEANGQRLLSGTADLAFPYPIPGPDSSAPAFYSTTLPDGRSVRAAAYVRRLYDAGRIENVVVAVAKTQGSRDAMVARLWHPQLIRQILTLILAMLLVYLGLTFELRPLMKLKDDVADRNASELRPIQAERLHFELRPIVDAINQCIARMGQQAATQRQFISDAAHQLRTPLTLLDTQIQFARHREHTDPRVAEALSAMHKSSGKMTALTNKLLLLAHAESSSAPRVQHPVDLALVIGSALEELIAFAQVRQIDLGAELGQDLLVAGDESLTTALVMNLIDNALRYTQVGGRVTVAACAQDDAIVMRVVDNGPGISPEARARVFERFYRASGDTDGTGLGLSIVREIAVRQGGTVTLEVGEGGVGLIAKVEMRRWHAPVHPDMTSIR